MVFSTTDQHESGKNAGRVEDKKILRCMKEICGYEGKSEKTVSLLIRDEGFPAAQIGGRWESDAGSIDAWRRCRMGK